MPDFSNRRTIDPDGTWRTYTNADSPAKGGKVDAIRRDDGTIGWLRLVGRIHRRQ